MEKVTQLWFLQSIAERFLSQDRSLLQFHHRLHSEESADYVKASQGWLLNQVNGAEANSDCISSEEPEGKPGDALVSAKLRHAGFFSVCESHVQIAQAVSRPDEEDDELIAEECAVPSHSEAYVCLSTYIWWPEAQVHCDPVSVHLPATA